MKARHLIHTAAIIVGYVASSATHTASASVSHTCPYSLQQTFSAALRLLRIDNGFVVTERDPDAAYIMFLYESRDGSARTSPGAIEMVPSENSTRVIIRLPQMPRYHEDVLLNSLKRKLEADYNSPTPKPNG